MNPDQIFLNNTPLRKLQKITKYERAWEGTTVIRRGCNENNRPPDNARGERQTAQMDGSKTGERT